MDTLGASFEIRVSNEAKRNLRRMRGRVRTRAVEFIDTLKSNPTPDGSEKMGGYPNRWKCQFHGGYRILWEVNRNELRILIVKIGPRGDVYK